MEALEQKYAEGLQTSAREVFETMIFMTPESVQESEALPSSIQDEIVGVLGFTGTNTGALNLSCSKALAATICANMLGMSPEEIEDDAEIADSFGEIANMIGGNFKNLWVEDGNAMDLAIPSVLFGEGVSLNSSKGEVVYGISMEFTEGKLDLHIRFVD